MADIGPDYNPEEEVKKLILQYVNDYSENALIEIISISTKNMGNSTIQNTFGFFVAYRDAKDRLVETRTNLLRRLDALDSDKLTGNGGET
jgi:hypothetical protein